MVGMARSKKKKVEASNPTVEGAAEIECDAGAAGEQQQALDYSSEASSEAAPQERVRTAAQEKRWQAALERRGVAGGCDECGSAPPVRAKKACAGGETSEEIA